MSAILFISDLHLRVDAVARTDLFFNFLKEHACNAKALYILGDLFSAWIGHDIQSAWQHCVLSALQQLSKSGISVYFMPGNRDFLLNPRLIQCYDCHWLDDPTLIDLFGKPTLLTHGDSLCTLDKRYHYFRRIARHPLIRHLFLKLPTRTRQKIAAILLRTSDRSETSFPKLDPKFDVVMTDVLHYLEKNPAELLIHGHTHQPCIHLFRHHLRWIKRVVLSDWGDQAQALVYPPDHRMILTHMNRNKQIK